MISSSREHIIENRNNLSVFGICQSTEPIREEQVTHQHTGILGSTGSSRSIILQRGNSLYDMKTSQKLYIYLSVYIVAPSMMGKSN